MNKIRICTTGITYVHALFQFQSNIISINDFEK